MSVLQRIAEWLGPDRHEEKRAAEEGMRSAKARLQEVTQQEPEVSALVRAHQRDRSRNQYGERILHALRGEIPQ